MISMGDLGTGFSVQALVTDEQVAVVAISKHQVVSANAEGGDIRRNRELFIGGNTPF